MVKYLLDKRIKQPVTLFYSAKTADDIAYREIFETARRRIGLNAIYTLTEPGVPLPDAYYRRGYIDAELIRNTVPDYASCLFYISGTHSMVNAIHGQLNSLGVPHHQIKVDFFPGYV
jgi:ferredoxin-NADP reductase